MSALMLADGNTAELLGCCQHWCAQPGLISEFQHSAMVRARPPVSLLHTVADWARELTVGFNLRGLCGFDFILRPDGTPILLEINPRPPASFELFEADEGLFTAHVEACDGRLARYSLAETIRSAAVYYASRDWRTPAAFPWPQWSKDRPLAGADVARGQPLCTVVSESDTSAHARDVTQRRIDELGALVNKAADGQSI
jgi:predicted ATP-grasp superfamily ATP-dependent carboligase